MVSRVGHQFELFPEAPAGLGVVDVFCGAGGLSVGVSRAGFGLLGGFDQDAASIRTYRRNLGVGHVVDVAKLSAGELIGMVGCGVGELGLLVGGPPCQGFSKQKRGAHVGDVRNELVGVFLRLVSSVRPWAFVMENVPLIQKRGAVQLEGLSALAGGYELCGGVYQAERFGLAQSRSRYVMVGIRRDVLVKPFVAPVGTERRVNVGEVIGGMPVPPADGSPHPGWANHYRSRISDRVLHRFCFVPAGGGWRDIPVEYRAEYQKRVDVSKGGWPDAYGRLEWGGLCPTITGGFDSFTRGRFGHPEQDRALTPREAARLQGFDDAFVFLGNRSEVRHQIGNAVPPSIAEAIGLGIREALGT